MSEPLIPDLPRDQKDRLRRRLELFYSEYNPENSSVVPKALQMNLTERDLFQKLYERYNVAEIEERERAALNNCEPPQLQEAHIVSPNDEEVDAYTLVNDYPQAEKDRVAKRLMMFYEKHAPNNKANAKNALKVPKTEEELFRLLHQKYNVFSLVEEKESAEANLLPFWFDPDLLAASPLNKFTVVGKCPRTKLPFISLPKEIRGKLSATLGENPAIHHLLECSAIKYENEVNEKEFPIYLIVHSTGLTICDRESGKVRKLALYESFESIYLFHDDPRIGITVARSRAGGNITLDGTLNMLFKCDSIADRRTLVDVILPIVNKPRPLNQRVLVQHCEPTPTLLQPLANNTGDDKNDFNMDDEDAAAEEIAAQTENVASVANVPDREEGTLLCDLEGAEKLRVATRLYLFYRNHVSVGDKRVFAKIPSAMKMNAGERYVFYVLCTKYSIAPSQEKREAYEADLISEEEINMSASGVFSPTIMSNASAATFSNNNDNNDGSEPQSPSSLLSRTSNGRKSRRGTKKVELPANIREALENDSHWAVVNQNGQVFVAVPKSDKKNINNLTGEDRDRVIKRLKHFYTTFASFVTDADEKIEQALQKLAVNEKVLLDILCRKYLVDSGLEESEARANRLLPANEMKKDIHGDRVQDDPMNSSSSNANEASANDLFNDDYLYANDPMNAVGLSYAKQSGTASGSPQKNKSPGSFGGGGDRDTLLEQKDQEIAELKRQLEEANLEKEFMKVELDSLKEALGEVA